MEELSQNPNIKFDNEFTQAELAEPSLRFLMKKQQLLNDEANIQIDEKYFEYYKFYRSFRFLGKVHLKMLMLF